MKVHNPQKEASEVRILGRQNLTCVSNFCFVLCGRGVHGRIATTWIVKM